MPLAKRATQKLHALGINDLQVKKGLWGYYLDSPSLRKQTSRCYKTEREVLEAARRGERPTIAEKEE